MFSKAFFSRGVKHRDCVVMGSSLKSSLSLFPKQQILDAFYLKDFADDYFKFDENGGKFSKGIENTVGKGEIARYEQFLLFSVFLKDLCCRHIKSRACLGKG